VTAVARRVLALVPAACLAAALSGCGSTSLSFPTPAVAEVCGSPDAMATLSVTRTNPFPQNQITFSTPDHMASDDAPAIAALARTTCALPPFPTGSMSCPADFGISYAITFSTKVERVGTIEAKPTGCPSVTGLGPERQAAPSFWRALATALGLPAPRVYCDPFRGRLPTMPTQCGPIE